MNGSQSPGGGHLFCQKIALVLDLHSNVTDWCSNVTNLCSNAADPDKVGFLGNYHFDPSFEPPY